MQARICGGLGWATTQVYPARISPTPDFPDFPREKTNRHRISPGVEFLRRFLQHVLPRGFHKVLYYGLWHPSKRDQSNRAWLLLILATPPDSAQPLTSASLSDALSQLAEPADQALDQAADHDAVLPICPHCGSCRTRFLGEYRRFGVP